MSASCVVDYFYDGKYEGKIVPELADVIEAQARKQNWEVIRKPFELRVRPLTNSTLW